MGVWSVTAAAARLVNGSCSEAPLPTKNQATYTEAIPKFSNWYMSVLAEYLAVCSTISTDSEWAMATFSTVVAAMYWSRMTWMNGWDKPAPVFSIVNQDCDEAHYFASDSAVSIKQSLNPTWSLYFVLFVHPVLTTILLIASLMLKATPVSKGVWHDLHPL